MDGLTAGATTRLGFIGAGGIVQRALAPAAHAATGVVVQAVAARDRARAAALGPVGNAYDDYRALLDDPEVDVVYVALDNAGHLPWTLAALEAGKHVICEKPLGLDPGAVTSMIEAAHRADRLLVEAFWYRWHPRTRRLEQLLRQGALGPLLDVEADFTFDGPVDGDPATQYRYDPERGGGGIYDVGCYALSLIHLALGPVLEVTGAQARWSPSGVDVQASAQLRSPAGATATMRCGIAAPDRQVVRVRGEAATVAFGDPAFYPWLVPTDLTITTPDRAVRTEAFAGVDPYRLMIEAVGARARGEEAYLVPLAESVPIAQTTAAVMSALTP